MDKNDFSKQYGKESPDYYDFNKDYENIFIPQWFNKSHFESFLGQNLTDKQFQRLKDHLTDGSGDYLADSISEDVRILLNELKESYPEIFS